MPLKMQYVAATTNTGMKQNKILLTLLLFTACYSCFSQVNVKASAREHLLMDYGWNFAFGHSYDTKKDFNNGTSYFSFITKAGYGNGATASNFEDRTWRKLDLPYDWAVEQLFLVTGRA